MLDREIVFGNVQGSKESEGQYPLDPEHVSTTSQTSTDERQTVVERAKVVEFVQQTPVHGTHPN